MLMWYSHILTNIASMDFFCAGRCGDGDDDGTDLIIEILLLLNYVMVFMTLN